MCAGPFVLTTFYRKKITTRRELDLRFESLVNTEGFQTACPSVPLLPLFESLVNTEGFQTIVIIHNHHIWFESLVNTEGFQTVFKRQE